MTAKFPESDSRIEKYHDGFNVEYRSDGIIIYHAYTATRDTIDAWFDVTVKHDQEHLAMGRHIRRIIYMHGNILPTPYALARAREADARTPDGLRESAAIVVDHILTYRLLAVFVNRLPGHAQSVVRVFSGMEGAVAWLDERLRQLGE